MSNSINQSTTPPTNRQLFFRHLAQTSPEPIGLEIVKAKGIYQYDVNEKKYIDLISGFGVANIGHGNQKIIEAVQQQAEKYMHVIVFGEFIQAPQVAYAKLLTDHLPPELNAIYFTNSGTEAAEGALKLAKRLTNRSKIIAFNKSYHGSTQGALSVMGDEYWRNAYRPILPGVYHFDYGSDEVLKEIDEQTACVILETVQAESGIISAGNSWLQNIRTKCTEKNVLLIIDEVQTGFGRTGSLWAFEQFNIIPDILLAGKALGGGMPLGAFIANRELMQELAHDPVLGHITTFGGHPVSCVAGKAALEILLDENYMNAVKEKEEILKRQLDHPKIIKLNTCGLWASVRFKNFETNKKIISKCLEKGLITDWFLFSSECMRIAPPLIITGEELIDACRKIIEAINDTD